MVLHDQRNVDFMQKLQESGLRDGYPDIHNPSKRAKISIETTPGENGYDSMDDEEVTKSICSQIHDAEVSYMEKPIEEKRNVLITAPLPYVNNVPQVQSKKIEFTHFMERKKMFNRLWDLRNIIRERAQAGIPVQATIKPMKEILGMEEITVSLEELFRERQQKLGKNKKKNGVLQKKSNQQFIVPKGKPQQARRSRNPNNRWAMIEQIAR